MTSSTGEIMFVLYGTRASSACCTHQSTIYTDVNKCCQTDKGLLIVFLRERDFIISVCFRYSRRLSRFKQSVVLDQSDWCQTVSLVPKNISLKLLKAWCSLSSSWMQFVSVTMMISEIQGFLTTAAVTYFSWYQHLMQTLTVLESKWMLVFVDSW